MSRKELALKASLDASYVTLIEQGKRAPSSATVSAIARALGVPVHLLAMLGADGADLKGISSQEAEAIGRRLLSIIADSDSNGSAS